MPDQWWAWPNGVAAGAALEPIHVTGPVRYEAHCMPGIALQSDFPPSPRRTEPRAWPKQKQALAVSSDHVSVEPIELLRVAGEPSTVPIDRDIMRAAETPFRLLAEKALAKGRHPVKLGSWPVRWTKAWRYPLNDGNGQVVYLLEGRIQHDDWRGAVTGYLWLKVRGSFLAEHRGHAVLDDEDAKMSVSHVPFGVVRIGGHHFWVSERRGWEHEAYQLIDLTSSNLPEVLLVRGGGC